MTKTMLNVVNQQNERRSNFPSPLPCCRRKRKTNSRKNYCTKGTEKKKKFFWRFSTRKFLRANPRNSNQMQVLRALKKQIKNKSLVLPPPPPLFLHSNRSGVTLFPEVPAPFCVRRYHLCVPLSFFHSFLETVISLHSVDFWLCFKTFHCWCKGSF